MTDPLQRAELLTAIGGIDLDVFAKERSTVIVIDDEYRIIYFNPAYSRFAEENGGQPKIAQDWGLGKSIMSAINPELQPFYTALFLSVIASASTPRPSPATHCYECSSPSLYRQFALAVYPLHGGKGLLLVHSLVVEKPHEPAERAAHAPDLPNYLDNHGFIRQCSHCRRVQTRSNFTEWHWVPQWVGHSPGNVSHGLCPICLEYYYPPADDNNVL